MRGSIVGIAKIHGRGRVQIPLDVREYLRIKDGDSVYFVKNGDLTIRIERAPITKEEEKVGKY